MRGVMATLGCGAIRLRSCPRVGPAGDLTGQRRSCMFKIMRTRVSSKGQVRLPAEFRRRDGIKPGQPFEIERLVRGEYRLKRIPRRPNAGLVDLLLACPVKGWFRPLDREETNADLDLALLK